MTDYAEEKASELEVLESIYDENYSISASGLTFSVILVADEDEDDHEERQKEQFGQASLGNFALRINFQHPETYPDEAITYSLERLDEDLEVTDDCSRKDELPDWLRDLYPLIDEQIEENLGMQHAFTVSSCIQDYLTEKCEELNVARKAEIDRLKEEAENAHTKKLIGTPVTLETFTQWQIKFSAEMRKIIAAKQSEEERKQADRLTGKVLFNTKVAKNDDDIDLDDLEEIEEGGEKVQVDEALFDGEDLEDLEDLEITDDEEEEEGEDADMREALFNQ